MTHADAGPDRRTRSGTPAAADDAADDRADHATLDAALDDLRRSRSLASAQGAAQAARAKRVPTAANDVISAS